MTDISCIIVSFNSEQVIRKCLESIVSDIGEYTGEIIIVDNASNDNTLSVVRSVKLIDSCKIIIIENLSNLGFTRAVNQGLSGSKGEFVVLLNPDTVIHANFFTTTIHYLNDHDDTGIVAPQHIAYDGSVVPSCRKFPNHLSIVPYLCGLNVLFPKSKIFNGWKMGNFDHSSAQTVDQPMGACLVTKKIFFEVIGYLDEQFHMFFSDVDWCKRYDIAGKKSVFLPTAKITHEPGHSVRKMPVRMIVSSHWSFLKFFRKYYRGYLWILPNFIMGWVLLIAAAGRIGFSAVSTRKKLNF